MKISTLITVLFLCVTTEELQSMSIDQFANSLGFQPLNPPQRVISEKSTLWQPGTVIYLDRVRRKIFQIPACEQLFETPPTFTNILMGTEGRAEERRQNSLAIVLNLIGDLVGLSSAGINARLDDSNTVKVSYSHLGALLSTSEDISIAAGGTNNFSRFRAGCIDALLSPRFNEGSGNRIRFRQPLYLITSTGIARGIRIELNRSAQASIGAQATISDLVEVKPSWSHVRSTSEHVEIEALDRPIVWGYKAIPISEIVRSGRVSAEQVARFELRVPSDGEYSEAIRQLATAEYSELDPEH